MVLTGTGKKEKGGKKESLAMSADGGRKK